MKSAGLMGPVGFPGHGPALLLLGVGALLAVGCGSTAVNAPSDADHDTASADAAAEETTAPDDAAVGDADASSDLPVEFPPLPQPYDRPSYEHLSETGLYADFAAKSLSAGLTAFEPTHKLWSDGAGKRRWIKLPPGATIDTSDMDHWVFPIGTKLFKEFALDGVLLETRLIERYGTGSEDYWFGAFVWNAEQTDAVFVIDGQNDINSTPHDAPSQKNCGACHRGEPGRGLGFSAIQLSRPDNPPTLKSLAAAGTLSHPPAGGGDFPVPGDAPTVQAFGYLHANCGHCHNMNGTSWPDTQMVLRLRVVDRDPATSELFGSIVGKNLQYYRGGDIIKVRVAPGDPAASGVIARMESRTMKVAMPPLATEFIDPEGLLWVRAWISSLPP